MKKELIWWAGFGILSTLIVGAMTGFHFSNLSIQLHDTYYVFDTFHAIIIFIIIFGLGRYFYVLADVIGSKHKLFAILISVFSAIIGLLALLLAYLNLSSIVAFASIYPDIILSGQFLVPVICLGLVLFQVLIEINMIKKLTRPSAKK